VSEVFITAWVGHDYAEAALYMIVMLVPLTFDVAASPVWMALYARGRIGAIVSLIVPISIGNVTLSLILAVWLKMGPLGFAIGQWSGHDRAHVAVLAMQARHPDPTIPRVRDAMAPLLPAVLGGLPGLALLYFARPLLAGGLPRVHPGRRNRAPCSAWAAPPSPPSAPRASRISDRPPLLNALPKE
jgi:hypothetical protein